MLLYLFWFLIFGLNFIALQDYHRYHSPVSGTLSLSARLPAGQALRTICQWQALSAFSSGQQTGSLSTTFRGTSDGRVVVQGHTGHVQPPAGNQTQTPPSSKWRCLDTFPPIPSPNAKADNIVFHLPCYLFFQFFIIHIPAFAPPIYHPLVTSKQTNLALSPGRLGTPTIYHIPRHVTLDT